MIRRPGVLSLALLFGALASWNPPAAAQSASDSRLLEIFSGLGPSDPVQVITPSFFVENAFVVAVGPEEVGLTQNGTTVDVDFADIRGVSVESNHWLQGTLWGTGAGILVGGVSGLMWASFTCTTPTGCVDDEKAGMINGAAILGSIGGFGGFMFGRHSIYWRPVFP
jgi:hypothetical protein